MLKANGGINIENGDLIFKDLRIKTSHPTDARIFNIMFKKPNIKQGQFTSDLKFNGKLSNPVILGTAHIVETNIPFLDTTVKNLSFVFKEKTIELSSIGEIFGNDIKFKGTLKNKLIPPYYIENAELYTKIIDLNYITNKLKSAQIEEINTLASLDLFDLENFVIRNMKLSADEIRLRNITAKHVDARASINEKNVLFSAHRLFVFYWFLQAMTLYEKYGAEQKTVKTLKSIKRTLMKDAICHFRPFMALFFLIMFTPFNSLLKSRMFRSNLDRINKIVYKLS